MSEIVNFTPQRVLTITGPLQSGAAYTVEFFLSGTTTPVTVYQDEAATVPHESPVVANAVGVFPAVFSDTANPIKAVIKTGTGATYATVDPCIRSPLESSAASGVTFAPTEDILAVNVQDAIEEVDANFGAFGRVLAGSATDTAARTTLGLGDLSLLDAIDFFKEQAVWNAGTDTGQATISPAQMEAFMVSNSLGWGQTWQNVTASRAASTNYQNTTGRPIMVKVVSGTPAGTAQFFAGATSGSQIQIDLHESSQAHFRNVGGIIPDGWFYSYVGSLSAWRELR